MAPLGTALGGRWSVAEDSGSDADSAESGHVSPAKAAAPASSTAHDLLGGAAPPAVSVSVNCLICGDSSEARQGLY